MALCKEHAFLEFATDIDAFFVLAEIAAHFWHLFFERFASFPVGSGTLGDEGGEPDGCAFGSTENHTYARPKENKLTLDSIAWWREREHMSSQSNSGARSSCRRE